MTRYGVGLASLRMFGSNFPYGTLAINVIGSGLMGIAIAGFARLGSVSPDVRLFLTTGIIGGFTTFSTFSLDAFTLWERGEHLFSVGYVVISVALSLTALYVSLLIARRFI